MPRYIKYISVKPNFACSKHHTSKTQLQLKKRYMLKTLAELANTTLGLMKQLNQIPFLLLHSRIVQDQNYNLLVSIVMLIFFLFVPQAHTYLLPFIKVISFAPSSSHTGTRLDLCIRPMPSSFLSPEYCCSCFLFPLSLTGILSPVFG